MSDALLLEIRNTVNALSKDVVGQRVTLAEVGQRLRQIDARLSQIDHHVSQGDNALTTRVKLLEAALLEIKGKLSEAERKREEIRREALGSSGALRKEVEQRQATSTVSRGQVIAAVVTGICGLGGSVIAAAIALAK